MKNIRLLMAEIDKLGQDDLDLLLKEILRKVDKRKRLESALDSMVGSGKGVWEEDAQDYVRKLRENDRL